MQICSYCGRENEATHATCHECGSELRSEIEAPRDTTKLCRGLRFAFGIIGIGGSFLWLVIGFLILISYGFKPGGAQGGMSHTEWALCIVAVYITFVYYAIVSFGVWNRGVLAAGIVVHALWAAAVVNIVALSDGGFILVPLFLPGAVCWIAYAATKPFVRNLASSA